MGARSCSQSLARADKVKVGAEDWAIDSFAMPLSTDTFKVRLLSVDFRPNANLAAFDDDLNSSLLARASSSASKCGSTDFGNMFAIDNLPAGSLV